MAVMLAYADAKRRWADDKRQVKRLNTTLWERNQRELKTEQPESSPFGESFCIGTLIAINNHSDLAPPDTLERNRLMTAAINCMASCASAADPKAAGDPVRLSSDGDILRASWRLPVDEVGLQKFEHLLLGKIQPMPSKVPEVMPRDHDAYWAIVGERIRESHLNVRKGDLGPVTPSLDDTKKLGGVASRGEATITICGGKQTVDVVTFPFNDADGEARAHLEHLLGARKNGFCDIRRMRVVQSLFSNFAIPAELTQSYPMASQAQLRVPANEALCLKWRKLAGVKGDDSYKCREAYELIKEHFGIPIRPGTDFDEWMGAVLLELAQPCQLFHKWDYQEFMGCTLFGGAPFGPVPDALRKYKRIIQARIATGPPVPPPELNSKPAVVEAAEAGVELEPSPMAIDCEDTRHPVAAFVQDRVKPLVGGFVPTKRMAEFLLGRHSELGKDSRGNAHKDPARSVAMFLTKAMKEHAGFATKTTTSGPHGHGYNGIQCNW